MASDPGCRWSDAERRVYDDGLVGTLKQIHDDIDAAVSDAEAVMGIYNHEVLHTTATLDMETRTRETQAQWIRARQGANPVIVAERDDQVLGFASLSPFRERAAYRGTVENSIYVRRDSHGEGIGRVLLTELIERARLHGYHSVIARIAGDNAGSIALHERLGYEVVGIEREVGRKFGRWLDVTEMQLLL